ncbi:hypothetical protein [Amycolatopsis sp. PS_44_ISF1]|uniref:hypothetical protein n=1 Tax=Amycolatopsis sp. PS_44_ISF1 TaxID=2974917 RepID=UPI0028DE3A66|nr:hypothetical protein [Amycolatopsis sp. PS_44_ISF1]MDT8912945.1 hypothetical protein [Amycolatopsis sp. PS_44_ISF1]
MPLESTVETQVRLLPCPEPVRRARLDDLADAGLGFLGRGTATEPAAAIVARLDRAGAQLFEVRHGPRRGLFGVHPAGTNPYQAVIDVVLPGSSCVDAIRTVLAFCHSHLALRSVLRFGQVGDGREADFDAAGLRRLGSLRGALYYDGGYHDQPVWLGEAR